MKPFFLLIFALFLTWTVFTFRAEPAEANSESTVNLEAEVVEKTPTNTINDFNLESLQPAVKDANGEVKGAATKNDSSSALWPVIGSVAFLCITIFFALFVLINYKKQTHPGILGEKNSSFDCH
jgi:hypothetical protein